MTRLEKVPVVIAGAGPVGLTLALALARHGVRSVVLERKTELDPHSRATLVIPRSLEIFSALGVLGPVLTYGQVNPAIDILGPRDHHPLLRFDFASLRGVTVVPWAIAIPQDRTERILLDAVLATGLVDIRFETPLARFTPTADHVIVNESMRAQVLVGADGAHSAVRNQLGWTLEGTTYPTRALLADVRVAPEADVRGGWPTDLAADSFTIAVRFSPGVWRLIESAIPDSVQDADLPARARAVTERIFGADSWRDTLWTSAYRKHERRAQRYHEGRVVLAGDAAHLNSPAGGQGLNAGLQDAFSLAWRLAWIVDGRGDADVLLPSYSEERTRSFDADVRPLTNAMERMETLPTWARRAGFKASAYCG